MFVQTLSFWKISIVIHRRRQNEIETYPWNEEINFHAEKVELVCCFRNARKRFQTNDDCLFVVQSEIEWEKLN